MNQDIEVMLLETNAKSDCIFYARMVLATVVLIVLTCIIWIIVIAFS